MLKVMDIIMWLGLGLIAGGLVSLIYDDSLIATVRNIIFGLAGSILGGGIVSVWDGGRLPTMEFYVYSVIFTVISSLLLIGGGKWQSWIAIQKSKLNKLGEGKNYTELNEPMYATPSALKDKVTI